MASLGDLIVRIGAEISGFVDAMKGIKDELGAVDDKVGATSDTIQARMGEAMQSISERSEAVEQSFEGIRSGAYSMQIAGAEMTEAITEPLKELAEEALNTAAATEKLEIVLGTLLGSGARAKEFVEQLHALAATSPIPLTALEQGAQRMLAFQFAAKDVIPVMRTLGDVSAAFGKGQEGLNTLIETLGKITSRGTVTARDLTALNKFGGTAALASGLDTTPQEATAEMKAGKIDSTKGINALLKGWQQQFGGTAESEMSGLTGALDNLKNKVELTLDAIGKKLLPVGEQLVAWAGMALEAIQGLVNWFTSLPEPVQAAAASVLVLVAAIGPALVLLGGLALAVVAISAAFAILEPAIAAIGVFVGSLTSLEGVAAGIGLVASGPIGIVVACAAAVAALTALAVWVFSNWDGVKAAVLQIWDGLKEVWQNTLGIPLQGLIQLFEWVYGQTKPIWDAIGGALRAEWDAIKEAALTFWHFLKDDVLDPLFAALEKIPGVTKILGAGAAFKKGEAEGRDRDELSAAEKTLHVGGGSASVSDPRTAWVEKHKSAVEEATKALDKMREAHERGLVSLKDLTQATSNYQALLKEKAPPVNDPDALGKKSKGPKIDHNALDALSGQNAHEQALLQMQRSAVDHQYQMSRPDAADAIGDDGVERTSQMELAAAQKRKDALDALAKQELASALGVIDQKLALYRGDQDGYQKLISEKTKAQDKYDADTLKNAQAMEAVQKQVNDRLTADDLKKIAEDLKTQARANDEAERAARQHADAMAQIAGTLRDAAMRHEESQLALEERNAQLRLDLGEITKNRYLKIKQEEIDKAYEMEMTAINDDQAALLQAYNDARELATTPDERQRIDDDFSKKQVVLSDRKQQTIDRHTQDTQGVSDEKQKDQYGTFFKPIESNFASGIQSMIEGTKTFGQAWRSMVTGMLSSWIGSLSQMAARWITHKIAELTLHIATNQAKVASDASAAAQSKSISLSQHIHEVMLAAKTAFAHAFKAVAGIPIIGPILAPIAGAAAFVAVMAVSAERGGVMPDENTVALLHPKEMVLPSPISSGLQSLIANGGNMFADPSALMQTNSGEMRSGMGQSLSGGASAGDTTHNHFGGITVHNTAKDPITPDKVFNLMQAATRGRNLKMA